MVGTGNADNLVFKPPRESDRTTEDDRTFQDGEDNDPERTDSEASLIRKFERRVEFPEDLRNEQGRWQEMREYVHTDAMLLDEEDAVGTNFILRNQHVATSMIRPVAPAPRVEPRKWLPPMAGTPQADSMPVTYPADKLVNAKTHEILLEYQQKKGGMEDIIAGAAQDAQTLPIAWVKMRLQEDFELDPVGYGRNNDQIDLVQRFRRLRMDFDEGVFTERSPQFEELQLASNTIKAFVLDELQAEISSVGQPLRNDETGEIVLDDDEEPVLVGVADLQERVNALMDQPDALVEQSDLPEVAHYVGYNWQQVDPEDIRWDWNIRRPEDLRYAQWMAHRVWMTEEAIREKWEVEQDDLRTAARFAQDGYKVVLKDSADSDPEYGGKDPEERERGYGGNSDDDIRRGETLAVWELWDRVQGRVFRWVQGTGKFLDEYVPSVLPTRFYPFYPVIFNRVTGKMFGPSDTDLQQPLQDESNRMRTWQREAQKSAHPRWMVAKGLLRPSEKSRFEEALPYSLTEVERAEDVAKAVFPIVPPEYNAQLYDRTPTILEMQQMAGIPAAALGAGNMGMTATADAIANQQMGNQTAARQEIIEKVYQEMYEAMTEINAQVLPIDNVIEICGPGANWPELDRQTILSNFTIEVDAIMNDPEQRSQELKAWLDITSISAQLGLPLDPIPVTKKLLELMGIRDNIGRYMNINALLQNMGLPQPGGAAGGSAPTPDQQPEAQGELGAMGGAPAGAGMEGPPAPESLPGSPA